MQTNMSMDLSVIASLIYRMGFFSPREELSLPFFWSSRLTEIRQQEGNGF
jgi:hypothetical protein